MRARRGVALLCSALLVAGTAPAASTVPSAAAAVRPCSSGLVALTFDDGPSRTLTPRFLDLLEQRRVPATFFVVGERVRAHPGVVRRAWTRGFVIANHSYGHENLRTLSSAGVRSTLRRTQRAIRDTGARPSDLMRPPYGSIDGRVRALTADVGLVPVLWTADPSNWDGRTATGIANSMLAQLRPHAPNVVLLHDGVANSVSTLKALPRIIAGARSRGYCFALLNARGRPTPPVPRVRVSDASATETPGGSTMTATLTLDRPTSRATSVRLTTVGLSASSKDYVGLDTRVEFPRGVTRQVVHVRVRDDARDEYVEQLALRLSRTRGLTIKDGKGLGAIRDDDPPPTVTVSGAEVTEPSAGQVEVPVTLHLSRASGKPIQVTVTTRPGSADETDFVPLTRRLAFEPGQVAARLTVVVVADGVTEGLETFAVRATEGTNVDVRGATGIVTILPPAG